MNTVSDKQHKISFGKYKDATLEHEYQEASFLSMKKVSQPVIILLSFGFMLFLIGDVLSTPQTIGKILPIRAIVSLILLYFSIRIPTIKSYKNFYRALSFCELTVSIAFFYISSLYVNPEYILRMLSLVLMIFAYYVIPNIFLYSFYNSILIWFIFLLSCSMTGLLSTPKEWAIGIVYPLLFLITAISFHLRLEVEKREQYSINKILLELSTTDSLTKINNRSKFEAEIESYIHSISLTKKTFSLVLLDIDNFKRINDHYGHLCGDSVLIDLSSLIMKSIRKQDILARWGGEEFVILFPDTQLKDALSILVRTKELINTNTFSNNISITCSFGATQFKDTDTIFELIGRADKLMYQAKAQGKNQIIY